MLLKRFGQSQHDGEMEQHKGLVDLKLVSKYFPEGNFSYPRPYSGSSTAPLPPSPSHHHHHHHHQASSSSSSVTSVPSLVDDDRSSVHSMDDDAHHHVTASGLWDSFWQPGQPRATQVAGTAPYPAMIPLRTPPRRRPSPDHDRSLPRDASTATITAGHKRSASEETLLHQPAASPIKRKPVAARQSRPPVRGGYSLFPPPSPPRRAAMAPRTASLAKPLPPTPLVIHHPARAAPLTSINETSGRSNAGVAPREASPAAAERPAKAPRTAATAPAEPAPSSPAFQPALPSPLNPNHHQPSSGAVPPAAGTRRPSLPLFRPALPLRARSSSAATVPDPPQGQPQPAPSSSRPTTPTTPPVLASPLQHAAAACPPPRGPPPPPPPRAAAQAQAQAPCSPPVSPFAPAGHHHHPHPSTPPPRALYTPIVIPTDLPTPPSPPSPRSLAAAPSYPPPPTPTSTSGAAAGPSFPPLMTPALPLRASPGPRCGGEQQSQLVSYFDDSDDDEDAAEDGMLGLRRIARSLGLQHRAKGPVGGGDKPGASGRRRGYGRNDSTSSANTSFSSASSGADTSFSSAASGRSSTSSSDGGSTVTLATSRGPSWESQGPRGSGGGGSDEMGLRDALRMLSPEDCCAPAPAPARPLRVRRQKSEVFSRMLGLRR